MTDICKRKYKSYKIYLHNFSKFDGYFLIRYLSMLGVCNPIIHKGRIISCKFKLYENNYNVTFMDSMLLLPSSLRELGESFGLNKEDCKNYFPFKLNNINYKGIVPDFKYFTKISLDEYKKYKEIYNNKIWNFKEESIKYCYLDCISLHKILSKFNLLIFKKFKLNATNYLTLPSLAFNLFRSKYLKKDSIHMLSGEIAENIRKSYTGGAVDMYLTKSLDNKKIFAYDVNSLYPFVMKECKFPIGSPTYFEGNILKTIPDAFGFFYCKISVPSYINHPILRALPKNNNKPMFPTGDWEGMYFSEELNNAKKYGYTFEVLWGYTFEKGYIFKDYVNDLYELRLNYPKSDPMNHIAKLLLNSLYGRFGMEDSFINTKIINKEDYLKFENQNKEGIKDIINLGNSYLVQYKDPSVELETALDNGTETHNVNIAIASAVTAYARIHMSQFKNNNTLPRLFYTDTDSLYFDGPLPDSFIHPTILGKLKLVGIYDLAVFLAPKVYALKNSLEEIIKIKGLNEEAIIKNKITTLTLDKLLVKDSLLPIPQNKWFRHLDKGSIDLLNQVYTLKASGNKRSLIYNEDNLLIGSTPFIVKNGES
jgi:hypothetical protein